MKDAIKTKKAIFSMENLNRLQTEQALTERYLKIRAKNDADVMALMIEGKFEESIELMDKQSEMEQKLLNVIEEYDKGFEY